MPRFVVLRHELPPHSARPSHWDLMFDVGDVLRTWAIEESPGLPAPASVTALPDHRVAYLEFEGPVSGDRGHVARWDWGEYDLIAQSDLEWHLRLRGQRLRGTARLARVDAASNAWTWHYCAD